MASLRRFAGPLGGILLAVLVALSVPINLIHQNARHLQGLVGTYLDGNSALSVKLVWADDYTAYPFHYTVNASGAQASGPSSYDYAALHFTFTNSDSSFSPCINEVKMTKDGSDEWTRWWYHSDERSLDFSLQPNPAYGDPMPVMGQPFPYQFGDASYPIGALPEGDYTLTYHGHYTTHSGPNNDYTQSPLDGTFKFTNKRLTISGCTPEEPGLFIYDPATGGQQLTCTFRSLFKQNAAARLDIFSATGGLVKTLCTPILTTDGSVSLTWDGSNDGYHGSDDEPSACAKGLYCYRWGIGSGQGNNVAPTFDQDKSTHLTVSIPPQSCDLLAGDSAEDAVFKVRYNLDSDRAASQAKVEIYGPDLKSFASKDLSGGDLAPGIHTVYLSTQPKQTGSYMVVVTAKDNHADQDFAGRTKWALPAGYTVMLRPGGASLAVHVEWIKDYTTNPQTIAHSANGPIAGTAEGLMGLGDAELGVPLITGTRAHVTFTCPFAGFSAAQLSQLSVHEEAGHYPDVDLTQSPYAGLRNAYDYCPSPYGWGYIEGAQYWCPGCGDVDPDDEQAPSQLYATVPLETTSLHNGTHAVAAGVTYTVRKYSPDAPEGWVPDIRTLAVNNSFDVGNLVITGTTPENPTPILRVAGDDGSAPGPTNVRVSFTCAYRDYLAAHLDIYDSTQKRVRTLTMPAYTDSASVFFTWDGTGNAQTPDDAATWQALPRVVWLFQSRLADDTDKSTSLHVSVPNTTNTGQLTYTLSSERGRSASQGHIDVYDMHGLLAGTINLADEELTVGDHEVDWTINNLPNPPYIPVVCIEDDDGALDRSHRMRWALQHNNTGVPFISGSNCNYTFRLPSDFGTVTSMNVTISSTVAGNAFTIVPFSMAAGTNPRIPIGVRFASTDFPHGQKVVCRVHATRASGAPFDGHMIFYAYNRYGVVYGWDNVSGEDPKVDAIMQAMHHEPALHAHVGASLPNWQYEIGKLAGICRRATAIDLNMHGNVDWVGPTPDDRGAPADQIGDYVSNRQGIPPINVVFAYCCLTGADNSVLPRKFNIVPDGFQLGGTNWNADRAYVGFPVEVPPYIQVHQRFWGMLRSDTTVLTAMHAAQRMYDHQHGGTDPATLNLWGDPNARLIKAYNSGVPPRQYVLQY